MKVIGHLWLPLKEALGIGGQSTAGDKHETGRAMIHQEMRQVNDTLQRESIGPSGVDKDETGADGIAVLVASGVLVETTGPWVLVGLPLGKLPSKAVSCWA